MGSSWGLSRSEMHLHNKFTAAPRSRAAAVRCPMERDEKVPQYKTIKRLQKSYLVRCNESLSNIIPGSGVKPASAIRRTEQQRCLDLFLMDQGGTKTSGQTQPRGTHGANGCDESEEGEECTGAHSQKERAHRAYQGIGKETLAVRVVVTRSSPQGLQSPNGARLRSEKF
eukprot:s216_g36.t1